MCVDQCVGVCDMFISVLVCVICVGVCDMLISVLVCVISVLVCVMCWCV